MNVPEKLKRDPNAVIIQVRCIGAGESTSWYRLDRSLDVTDADLEEWKQKIAAKIQRAVLECLTGLDYDTASLMGGQP